MASEDYEDLEREVKLCLERQDHAAAATLAIRGLGAEIFGFLVSTHRSEVDAAEVFSLFAERLWRRLAAYQGDCSVRTWAYLLARHASLNYRRDEHRRQKRLRPVAETSQLPELLAGVRSETASFLRTDRQARFAALRHTLPVEDQMLLILRVDRGLSWNDLAKVLHDGAGSENAASVGTVAPNASAENALAPPLTGEALAREAARLRKRFQLLKGRLLALGRQAGVVTVRKED